MKTAANLLIIIIFCISATYAQVGINADNSAPHSSAILDVKSTSKAFYPPRMTTGEKDGIVGKQAGAVVYDINVQDLNFYNGVSWLNAGKLNLPVYQTGNSLSTDGLFSITNNNISNYTTGISATIKGDQGYGVIGNAMKANPDGATYGVAGFNSSININGAAVYGENSGNGPGLKGKSYTIGVQGNGSTGVKGIGGSTGVYGDGSFSGVEGRSEGGIGVFGISIGGISIRGLDYAGGTAADFSSLNGGYALITGGGNVGLGTLSPVAKVDIGGSVHRSHFYLGTNEDTFIRGGKAGSNVLINDITGQGNVGIGLTNPSYILDVNRRIRVRHTVDNTPDDNTAGIWYNNSSNVEGAFSGMKTDTEVGLFIGGDWRFWVNSDGVGYLKGALIQTSDKRLKKDFTQLNNSLTDIYKINGYHFRWIEEARNKDLQTGFIAQEIQKIFPELVQTDEKGFLSVNYIGLIPHLIEAVKELKNENDSLKKVNGNFENRLEKLEQLVNFSAKK